VEKTEGELANPGLSGKRPENWSSDVLVTITKTESMIRELH